MNVPELSGPFLFLVSRGQTAIFSTYGAYRLEIIAVVGAYNLYLISTVRRKNSGLATRDYHKSSLWIRSIRSIVQEHFNK